MMSSLMLVASRPARARLREVPDERWQVQSAVGQGRALDFPEENMRLEVFMPPWSPARSNIEQSSSGGQGARSHARAGIHSSFDSAMECRYGLMLTDGAAAIWCLLGGVPLPAAGASRQDSELRLSVALARAPVALKSIIGPLALPGGARTDQAANHAPEAMIGPDAIDMMLRLSREDVTVYARASATPALWLQLLGGMVSISPQRPTTSRVLPVDEGRTVSIPVQIAAGHLSAGAMSSIAIGDIVRLPTSFDTRGNGRLTVADLEVKVLWRSRSPQHEFEVVEVTPLVLVTSGRNDRKTSRSAVGSDRATTSTTSTSVTERYPMNDDDPEAPDIDLDDEPSMEFDDASMLDHDLDDPVALVNPADADRAAAAKVDKLPITMVAEIGMLTVTVGSLRLLQPGSLLKLGVRGQDEVLLRAADGPPIAYAELVDIGGHLGMQVTRLAAP